MNASCTICFEMFEEQDIVATKCGHVFHGRCIGKWISNSAKFCPECRAAVTKNDFTKLFLHTSKNDSLPDYSIVKNDLESSKADLLAMQCELKAAKSKIVQLQKHACTSETEKMKYYDSCNTLTKENRTLKLQLKEVHKLNTQIKYLESENSRLESQVEHFNRIQILLQGTKKEADQMFQQYCLKDITCHTAEEMASMMSVLRHELQKVKEQKNAWQYEKQVLSQKLGLKTAEYQKLYNSHSQLKNKLNSLEDSPHPILITSSKAGPKLSVNTTTPVSNNVPSTSVVNNENSEMPSITPTSYEKKKPLMKRLVIDKSTGPPKMRPFPCSSLLSVSSKRKPEDDDRESITRVGYNGLGCHERVVLPRKMQQFANPKPYKKNPNVKRAK